MIHSLFFGPFLASATLILLAAGAGGGWTLAAWSMIMLSAVIQAPLRDVAMIRQRGATGEQGRAAVWAGPLLLGVCVPLLILAIAAMAGGHVKGGGLALAGVIVLLVGPGLSHALMLSGRDDRLSRLAGRFGAAMLLSGHLARRGASGRPDRLPAPYWREPLSLYVLRVTRRALFGGASPMRDAATEAVIVIATLWLCVGLAGLWGAVLAVMTGLLAQGLQLLRGYLILYGVNEMPRAVQRWHFATPSRMAPSSLLLRLWLGRQGAQSFWEQQAKAIGSNPVYPSGGVKMARDAILGEPFFEATDPVLRPDLALADPFARLVVAPAALPHGLDPDNPTDVAIGLRLAGMPLS